MRERAVLELLYDTGTRESLEESRNLFNGLRSPRKDVLGRLMACCSSVKTVRLFLTWAWETGCAVPTASVPGVSRLRADENDDNGTLLWLTPQGVSIVRVARLIDVNFKDSVFVTAGNSTLF